MNWDLTYHFKNQEEFEKSLEEVNKLVEQFKEYEGKLSNEEYFVKYFLYIILNHMFFLIFLFAFFLQINTQMSRYHKMRNRI